LNKFYYKWEYYKIINIQDPNNDFDDGDSHTFCIILNNTNFNYSHMHNSSSPREIRIVGWNSTSNRWDVLLPYWVQTWRNGANETSIIWVRCNGNNINTWTEMAEIITECNGNSIQVSIMRGDSIFLADIVPEINIIENLFGEDTKRYIIGITSSGDYISKKLNIFEAFTQSIIRTYEVTELTILSIVKLFQGVVSTDTLGGPIMIAQMAGEQAKQGASNFVFFIALLSVNLAILNFLPIPVLDGGHLLFFFIEACTGSPVNTRVREIAQQAGMFVLLLLMIFVFYNDISRIFSS